MFGANKSVEISNVAVETNLTSIDKEDRDVVNQVVNKMRDFSDTFAVRKLPSKIMIIFHNVKRIKYSDLHKVNIITNTISKAVIHFQKKTIIIEKRCKHGKPPLIRKRRGAKELKAINGIANSFCKSQDIKEEDTRIMIEIFKTILEWTWGKATAVINLKRTGDVYNIKVGNLMEVKYLSMRKLVELGDFIEDLEINLEEKSLSFKVFRTDDYLSNMEPSTKRRRKNNPYV